MATGEPTQFAKTPASLVRRLLLALSAILTFVIIATSLIFAVVALHNGEAELQSLTDRAAARLASLLDDPLWDLDYDRASRIVDAFAEDQRVDRIEVYEKSTGKSFTYKGRHAEHVVSRSKKIVHGGIELGTITLTLNGDLYRRQVRNEVISVLESSVASMIAMLLAVWILISRLLRQPLADLTLLAGGFLSGNNPVGAANPRYREFRGFFRVLDRMREQIREHVAALESANQRLSSEVAEHQHTASALREKESSHRLMAQALQGANDCICIADTNDRILFVNDAFLRAYEYSADELIGKPATVLRAKNFEWRPEILTASHAGGWRGELLNQSKSGRTFPISLSTSAIRDEQGQVIAVVGVARDITAEREREEALKASEDKFAKAFAASPDCIAITSFGEGILEVNDAFETITGYTRDEIIGKTLVSLGIIDYAVRENVWKLVRENSSFRDFEFTLRRKNGEEAFVVASGSRINIGGRECLVVVNRDITEQKLAADTLRRTENRYRAIVENASDMIFTATPDGRCLTMNCAALAVLGLSAGEVSGFNILHAVVPEQSASVIERVEKLLRGEQVRPFELVIVNRHHKRITVEASLRAEFENGAVVAMEGIARDITQRKELESALRRAEKLEAVGRLAGGIAHDFNNLLTIILASCETQLSSHQVFHVDVQNAFNDIHSAAGRAASLTRQLLAFSRMQRTQPRTVILNDIITDIFRMISNVIGESVEVRFVPGADLGAISADPVQLQRILVNLAVNARDAMPTGGRLTFETRNQTLHQALSHHRDVVPFGEYVVLCVSDTGIGMDDEVRSHIFEPFFTTKGDGKGTGLGLSTVYGIVQQSGGQIVVDSQLGLGSTFTIYFPRVRSVSETAVAPEPLTNFAQGRETLLLVEDEDQLRSLVGRYLTETGYNVVQARDADEAMSACQKSGTLPAILITDVVLPGESGPALAGELQGIFPGLKTLFLSGYADETVIRHGALPDGTNFLQKPFTLQALGERVRSMLDGSCS